MIAWLGTRTPFPPLAAALAEPNGLLAAGGDLSPDRLLLAYRRGIFPVVLRRPTDSLVESRSAHGALRRRAASVAIARQARPVGGVRGAHRQRVRGGHRGLRRLSAGGSARHLDHARDHCARTASCTGGAMPIRSRAGGTDSWSAACTGLRSGACFSANRCSRASPTRPRWRSSTWWRSCSDLGVPLIDCQQETRAPCRAWGAPDPPGTVCRRILPN